MRVEARTDRLVLVAEGESESKLLDQLFGSKVDEDGIIATVMGEVKLSDGYAEHYITLQKAPTLDMPIIRPGKFDNPMLPIPKLSNGHEMDLWPHNPNTGRHCLKCTQDLVKFIPSDTDPGEFLLKHDHASPYPGELLLAKHDHEAILEGGFNCVKDHKTGDFFYLEDSRITGKAV